MILRNVREIPGGESLHFLTAAQTQHAYAWFAAAEEKGQLVQMSVFTQWKCQHPDFFVLPVRSVVVMLVLLLHT